MDAAHKLINLGVFVLLALPVAWSQSVAAVQGQAATSSAEKKPAETTPQKKPENTGAPTTNTSLAPAVATRPWHVAVDSVASDQLSLDVIALYPSDSDKTTTIPGAACTTQEITCKRVHLVVQDTVVKDQLKQLQKGDHIQVVYTIDASKNQNTLKTLSVDSISDTSIAGVWAILGSAVICLLLYCSFSGFKPQQLIIGQDNRYSNSKFQMALWFFVLITSYIAALWIRVWSAGWHFLGGVNIPKNLLLLSGLSALTYAGAKAITSTKSDAPDQPVKTRADTPRFLFDLTHDDGVPAQPAQPAVGNQPAVPARDAIPPQFDFGDFQMLVITLIAVVTYIALIFDFFGLVAYTKVTTLPDVDTTILATFGLGQGAYLTKKAVGDVGTS
jgi:hypothetical protein